MQLAQSNGMQQTWEQVLSLARTLSTVQGTFILRYANWRLLDGRIGRCLLTHFTAGVSSGVSKTDTNIISYINFSMNRLEHLISDQDAASVKTDELTAVRF